MIEAMMVGLPIVALATTEMATVIKDGVNGFIDTDTGRLVAGMRALLDDREAARRMGDEARRTAFERFNIRRFVADWNDAFYAVAGIRERAASSARERSGTSAAPARI